MDSRGTPASAVEELGKLVCDQVSRYVFMSSVAAIRSALDLSNRSVALHLLGTGNPLSIALFTWAGADSFDADYGGIALQFTRNAAAEVTEVKISGGRVRNFRHTRVALPKT